MNENWKKKIILFLTSQTISLFGSSLVQYAISWYITLETKSGVMMTIAIICGFLPTFFLSPFAGVWADRYNRKRLILISDSTIALATLVIAILFLMGYKSIWLLFVVSVVRALGTAVQTPTVGALIPQLVPEDKLTKVNAANGSIQSMVMLVSPMLSGALLTMAPMEIIFFIDVVTAAVAVSTLLLFLKVPSHEKALAKQSVSYLGDMTEGYRYIKNHAFVRKIIIYSALFSFLAAPAAFLTPLQVTRSFGDQVWRLTAIEIVFSVGMILGGILMASWGGFKKKIHSMVTATVAMGVGTFALGIAPVFWLYLLMMSLIGLAMPLFNTPFTVLLQQKVEADYLGRVFGVFGMASSIMMPAGMLVFGPLSDAVRIEWLLLGTGLLIFLEGFVMLADRVLKKVESIDAQ